jgi:trigger factor
MADIKLVKVKRKKIEVSQEKIDKTLEELRKMQKQEVLTNKPTTKQDKVVVDLEMLLDKVSVEGGQAKDHQIYLFDNYYVPGLPEQLVGLTKGETKEFNLPFPQEHYNKNLAGKNVDFKVKIKDIYEVKLPELSHALAKSIGFDSLEDLQKQIKINIQQDEEQKEEQRLEGAIVDELIKKSEFTDIPEVLLDAEIHKMVHELEEAISVQGLKFEDYLKHIKKTKEDLRQEFISQAERRVKGALLMREIALEQNIEVGDEEVQKEVDRLVEMYKNDSETQDKIKEEGYREFLRNVLVNRKVIEYLKKSCVD